MRWIYLISIIICRHYRSRRFCLLSSKVLWSVPVFSICLSYKGMCQPRKMGTVGAEPFSAKLRYTGADDPKHPNLIKVTVTMPHIDGRLEARTTDEVKCNVVCVIFTSGDPREHDSQNIDLARLCRTPL